MNKEEFFSELEESLRGEVSENEFRDSVSYYRGYFREQEALGKSEEEILSELGNARYIARSIIDAHGVEHTPYQNSENYNAGRDYNDPYRESAEDAANDLEPNRIGNALNQVGRVMLIIAALLVVGIVLRFLLPFILVIIAVIMISNMFRRL